MALFDVSHVSMWMLKEKYFFISKAQPKMERQDMLNTLNIIRENVSMKWNLCVHCEYSVRIKWILSAMQFGVNLSVVFNVKKSWRAQPKCCANKTIEKWSTCCMCFKIRSSLFHLDPLRVKKTNKISFSFCVIAVSKFELKFKPNFGPKMIFFTCVC